MIQPAGVTERITELTNHFDDVLDRTATWSTWKKQFNGVTWERHRMLSAQRVDAAPYQLVSEPRRAKAPWVQASGRFYVLGEGEGTILRAAELLQLEVRMRNLGSKKVGKLIFSSWQLAINSQPHEVPVITPRQITPEEWEEQKYFGTLKEPQAIAIAPAPVNLILDMQDAWHIRDGTPSAAELPRFDVGSQVGRLMLDSMYNTAQEFLPPAVF